MLRGRSLRLEKLENRQLLSLTPLGVQLPLGVSLSGSQSTFAQTPTPSVAADAEGNYVAVWANSAHDGSGWGVFAQRFDNTGTPQGDSIAVNVETESDQSYPGVAMDDAGNFVVTWSSLNQDRSGYGVYARRFDAEGVPQSSEYRINTVTADNQIFSAVAMDADGDFVITWTSQGQDGSGSGIFGQRFTSAGAFAGDEFQVNTTSLGNQRFSSVAMADDGQFLVTWTGLDGSGNGIFARHYDAAGIAGGDEFRVNTTVDWSQQFSSVAIGPSGHCLVAWESFDLAASSWNVVAQRFAPDGARLGSEMVLAEGRHTSVTVGRGADFVVAWETYDPEHLASTEVHVQHYDPDGEPLGDTLEAHSAYDFDQVSPSVLMTGDRLVLFWTADSSDGTEVVTVYNAVTPDGAVNQPPVLTPIDDQTVNEGETLELRAIAVDGNEPADALAFRLSDDSPEGAEIDPITGEFRWTPGEEHGPGTHVVTIEVIDSGEPALGHRVSFSVTVDEVNRPPVIEPVEDLVIDLGETLDLTVAVTDEDLPANTLMFALGDDSPAEATIDPETGRITWTPEATGDFSLTVVVDDGADPPASDSLTFSVVVEHALLDPIEDQTIDEGTELSLTAVATAPLDPAVDGLVFGLDPTSPASAVIDPTTGVFTWTPEESEGPGTYSITVRLTDAGDPSITDSETFTVTVEEVNQAPILDPIALPDGGFSVDQGEPFALLFAATDEDLPPNELTFELLDEPPEGAELDAASGQFTWTPPADLPPGDYEITVRVTDDGTPPLSDETTITITVAEVVPTEMLDPVADQVLANGETLDLIVTATHPDGAGNPLAFDLRPGAPEGLEILPIDDTSARLLWTPAERQWDSRFEVTVRVKDDGTPAKSDTETFSITVGSANNAPELLPIKDVTLRAGAPLHIPLNAVDFEGDVLSFSVTTDNDELRTHVPEGNRSLEIEVRDFGPMVFELFEQRVPRTTGRIIELAESDFYDGLIFHRVIPSFMIQGGDPSGNGTGGSGTTFDDEFHPDLQHTTGGLLSMANRGDDTNDSQFFITDLATRHLDFNHSVFGLLVEGDDVREAIEAVETGAADKPDDDVVIESMRVFVDERNGVLMLAADPGVSGEAQVTVTVSDGHGGSTEQTFHVTIQPDAGPYSNAPPFLEAIGPIETTVDTPIDFIIPAVDVEGDAMEYSGVLRVDQSDLSLSVSSTSGSAVLTPTEGLVGVHAMELAVRSPGSDKHDSQAVPIFIKPGAPTAITLSAESDTGISDNDLLTSLDNTAERTLTFQVDGVVVGAEVTLFADGQAIGQAVADDVSVAITTDGGFTLIDGPHAITAQVVLRDQAVDVGNRHDTIDLAGPMSAPLEITVDAVAPVFTSEPITQADVDTEYVYDAETDDESTDGVAYFLAVTVDDTPLPDGMAIDPETGVVTWTPTGSQSGTHPVVVRAVDAVGNVADQAYDLTVADSAPQITPIDDQDVAEGSTLVFAVDAVDDDLPLQFSLEEGTPDGAAIDPDAGTFTWTPEENQGPGDFEIAIRVTDATGVWATETVLVSVTEVNEAPELDPIEDRSIGEGQTLLVQAHAVDVDRPGNGLTYVIASGAEPGMAIDAATGAFTWTPTEGQGPGVYEVTIRVADDGAPSLSDTATFTITVGEENLPPVLDPIDDQTIVEGQTLVVTAQATDGDAPADTLIHAIDSGAVAGMAIDPVTGEFTWTPTEAQGPGIYEVTIRVSDDGTPSLGDTQTFAITVGEENVAPALESIDDQTVAEGQTLSIQAVATDADRPGNQLTYRIESGAVAGMAIDPATGEFTWTPTESQGPATFEVTIGVTDDAALPLGDTTTFTITVDEGNRPPVLEPIDDQTIIEGRTLVVTPNATDDDIPANTLTYAIDSGAVAGMAVDPASGEFTWMPTEEQGAGVYEVTIRASDDGTPSLSDTQTFTITVDEENVAPILESIDDQTITEGDLLSVQAVASDADQPANTLTYAIDAGAVNGMAIDPVTGEFTWTPTEGQGPGSYDVTIRVTDDGTPSLSDTATFAITVASGNQTPRLDSIADATVEEGRSLTIDITAGDEDADDELTFSLEPGAPKGMAVDPATGRLAWATTEADGPGDYDITVRVTDNGSVPKSHTTTFRVTVTEINQAPVLDPIADQVLSVGETLSLKAKAVDEDLPGNMLYYSLDLGAPKGAAIDAASGRLTWTPSAETEPGWYEMTVRVVDSGSPGLDDTTTFRTLVLGVAVEGQADLGEVDYLEFPSVAAVDGDRYVLRPMRDGLLTIEAVFARSSGDVDLTLFDSEGRRIAASTAGTDGARLDATVVAGQPLQLKVGGSNPSVVYRIANLVSSKNGRTTLHGTTDDDTFAIRLGASHSVTINGVGYQLDSAGSSTLVVRGHGGSDGLSLTGTTADESVVLRPQSAELTGPAHGVEVKRVERIKVIGAGGNDIATMHDSTGDDEFVATPTYAGLVGDGFLSEVESFVEVHAYSDAGGIDVAKLFDSPGDDNYVGTPIYGALLGTNYFNEAVRFDGVHAYAANGGTDIAKLFDSDGDDTFYGDPTVGALYGEGYFNRAKFFDAVHGYGTGGGGNDVATLYDSTGDDTFYADPIAAALHGDGFFNRAKLFGQVIGHATAGGNDVATLYDSPGDDEFVATPTHARLYGDGFANEAQSFGEVHAHSTAGGTDVAKLFDSAGDDNYVGTPVYGALYGTNYLNEAIYFDGTHAYATNGGTDVAKLFDSDGDDTFYADPTVGALYGEGYFNRVKSFDAVHAYGTGGAGHDTANLYDSPGDDKFHAEPTAAALYGEGFFNRVKMFDEVFGHATAGGNDSALLLDSEGKDVVEAAGDWVRLFNVAAPFRNQAVGFKGVTVRSNHGPDLKEIDAAVDFLILEGVWNDA